VTTISHAAEAPRETLSFAGVAALTLGALDIGLEGSIIVPALPQLATHYHASTIAAAWLATAFVLGSVVAVPVLSRLGDLYGKRRLLLVALAAFACGSLVCALSHSIALAIAGRAVQGFGAAAGPLTLALARDTVPSAQLPRVVGAIIGSASVGGGIGFLLGGVLVDAFSPAAIFWMLFGFALGLMLAIAAFVRESRLRTRVRLDAAGIALLGTGLVSLLLAISKGGAWGWTSLEILSLFAGALLLLASFVLVERHVLQPHLDLRLVATAPFTGTNVSALAFGFTFFIATYVIPQIAAAPEESGYGLGLSTTQIGLLLVPSCVAAIVTSWTAGRTATRVGSRVLVAAGGACGIVGYVSLAVAHESTLSLAAGGAVVGLGWGLILPGLYTVVLANATADRSAVAVSITALFRNIGVSVGVTATFAIIAAAELAGEFRSESGYTNAFLAGVVGASVTLLAALALPGRRVSRAAA
jgi:MFS family permease